MVVNYIYIGGKKMLLYRFRPARSILEQYHELENQIIHFSPKEDLNDPLEGYINMYWQGDIIAWKGLFKSYINCLQNAFFMYRLGVQKQQLRTIPIFLVESMLPTESYKKLSREIINEFVDSSIVDKIISTLGNNNIKITREDLKLFLHMVHLNGLKIIMKYHYLHGLMEKSEWDKFEKFKPNSKNIDDFMNTFLKMKVDKIDETKVLLKISSSIIEEMLLHGKVLIDITNDEKRMDFYYLFYEFPFKYLQQIENLIHPPCYISCFSGNYSNSSMWGNYADKHRGICMIFKTIEDRNDLYIPIERPFSLDINGIHKSYINTKVEKVIYDSEHITINFFEMLGMLNGNQIKYWFTDGNKKSQVLDAIEKDIDKWRKIYWEIFNKRYYTKTKEWEFEDEYRLCIDGMFFNYDTNESRNLKYNFNSLEGIIFGIETSETDKVKILEIISKKCVENKRNDFKIYQAYFDEESKSIKIYELKTISRNVVEGRYISKIDLRKRLEQKVVQALNKLYERDEYLIRNNINENGENHVSERAIVFRFGIYLEEVLRCDSEFAKYNLDNEYNRNIDEVKQLPKHENGVYPDLILHKRGNNDDNMLVIEIKTWWNPDIRADIEKLQAFTDSTGKYKYRFGLSITIDKYKPKLIWFENGVEIIANDNEIKEVI